MAAQVASTAHWVVMAPRTERRSQHGAESRRRILDATFELARELGYTATSIAKVSARSGLPASSIYWHFDSKDMLFAAVIEDSFESWLAEMSTWAVDPSVDRAEPAVRERVESIVRSISTNPHFWRLGLMLTLEGQPVEPAARRRFLAVRSQVQETSRAFFRAVLGESIADGRRERVLASYFMAVADGIFIAAQAEGLGDLDELTELFIAGTLGALAHIE